MIKIYYLVLTLQAASDVPETDGQAGTPRRMVQTDVSETEGRIGCPRVGKSRGMVQTVVPDTEDRDGGPRSGRPRRMPETDVPETEGTDTCAWDKWYRPVSLRRRPGRARRGCPREGDFGDGRPRRTCLRLNTYTDGADGWISSINCDVVRWPSGPADRKIGTHIFQCDSGA